MVKWVLQKLSHEAKYCSIPIGCKFLSKSLTWQMAPAVFSSYLTDLLSPFNELKLIQAKLIVHVTAYIPSLICATSLWNWIFLIHVTWHLPWDKNSCLSKRTLLWVTLLLHPYRVFLHLKTWVHFQLVILG